MVVITTPDKSIFLVFTLFFPGISRMIHWVYIYLRISIRMAFDSSPCLCPCMVSRARFLCFLSCLLPLALSVFLFFLCLSDGFFHLLLKHRLGCFFPHPFHQQYPQSCSYQIRSKQLFALEGHVYYRLEGA